MCHNNNSERTEHYMNTKNNVDILQQRFNEIRKMGWVKSKFIGKGAAGNTFESLLGKPEENSENPDFLGIEIKTRKENSSYPITLFRATPIGEQEYQIKYLLENFGSPDKKTPNKKNLGGSVCVKKKKNFSNNYQFSLKVDRLQKKIFLLVFDCNNNLIYDKAYWPFELLETKLKKKLSILCYIKVQRKFENGHIYFKYTDAEFYYLKDFESFVKLIEQSVIQINFCVYVYTKGPKIGKIYDHGTSFKIYPSSLHKLFNQYFTDELGKYYGAYTEDFIII